MANRHRGARAPHRLDPLLRPASIAIVGASPRPGSYGRGIIDACVNAGYPGELFLVNPNYREIDGRPCYPRLDALPAAPEHCILGVANPRIEAALRDAIAAGAKAATIFGSGLLDDGVEPPLLERMRAMAHRAGLLICGGNGSGFYNHADRVRCQMGGGPAAPAGSVTFIAQSGSITAAVCGNDGRLQFNLAVSSGQEITTDVSDYMDFALGMESTRAIGLFIETIRNPDGFVRVLRRAAAMDIPIVVNKVGRSEASQRFAVSHSGALTGNDAVHDAVFAHYGVMRVDDPDEFVATLQLLSTGRRAASGNGIVAMTDSGGERELLADVAAAQGVTFATIEPETQASLAKRLEYGLEPENPLDAWGTGHGFEAIFEDSMSDLLNDPNASLGIWVADLRDGTSYHEVYAAVAARLASSTRKPLAVATCYSKCINAVLANGLRDAGVPVLEGMRPAMVAARHALAYSRFRSRPDVNPPAPPPAATIAKWKARCAADVALDESESLALLADFGVPVVRHRVVESREAAAEAAAALGFPVAMKTAMAGIHHKSEVKGVHLGLADCDAAAAAYADLAARLGPRVMVSEMAPAGTEMVFGAINDPQFGPVAMIGAGGILVELLRDTRLALPPLDRAAARRLIDGLAIRPILDGVRGRPALDVDALADAFARFSVMIAALGGSLAEVDVNPIILGTKGVMAVDGLIIPAADARRPNSQ
ncbi:MAG: acyl-CoA synthetase [Alphaproteobacteria bacterium]|nr:MAG: acyl-CoA synthetase [Alphaproteobacteria bacterium]